MTTAATVVLGGPADDMLLNALVQALHRAQIPVVSVDLDAGHADDAAHETRYRSALAEVPGQAIIGGFSLGGRIAAGLCPELEPLALLCFAFPFHRAKDPSARHGLDALAHVRVPTRIIQGTRDNHGTQAEVRGYQLPATVGLVWLRDANHRFMPRSSSGLTHEAHVEAAAAAAITFVRDMHHLCP